MTVRQLKYGIAYSVDPNEMKVAVNEFGFDTAEEAAERLIQMCDMKIETLKESKRRARKVIREWQRKPTESQMKVINNLHQGLDAHTGLYGKSAFGGLQGTLMAMHKRGFLDSRGDLTTKALQHVTERKY